MRAWSPEKVFVVGFVLVFVAIIATAFWDAATCAEYGPPHTEYVMTSCGKNCVWSQPTTVRTCVRRK